MIIANAAEGDDAALVAPTPGYEWKAVGLLTLTFGLVGLDRWIIAPLFPSIMRDMHLGYQDLGNIVGILGIAWGISAIVMGRLSDRLGRKKIIIASTLLFSILAGVSGLAGSVLSLMMIRAVMGVMEGAYTPAGQAAAVDATPPRRRGMNLGIFTSSFGLFGLALAPIAATQLLGALGSWRLVFLFVSLPGFILTVMMVIVLRDPPGIGRRTGNHQVSTNSPGFTAVFAYSNVWVAVGGFLGAYICIVLFNAMLPSYLVDVLKLQPKTMGGVVSALGFGCLIGQIGIAILSDFLGRKGTAFISFIGAAICLYGFSVTGPSPIALFLYLLVASIFVFGLITLFGGPIAAEAVPPELISTSLGLVGGAGELLAGGLTPIIGGWVATRFGLPAILHLCMGGLIFGFAVTFALRETAPRLRKVA